MSRPPATGHRLPASRRLFPAFFALVLAACAAPATQVAMGPQAWIDAPLDGASLAVAPYLVTAHASHPDGVSEFVFMVNGSQESQIPVGADQAGQSLAQAAWDWTPPGPGMFTLEVYALSQAGAPGPSAIAHVFVVGATDTPTPEASPTPTSTPTPAPPAFGDPTASPATFYYNRNECGSKMVTVDVMLMGGDGPYNLVIFARLAEMDGPGRTEWTAMAMNSLGEGMFRRTLNSETDLPGFRMYVHSWLQVQFVAEGPGGAEAARSPVFPMLAELSRCP